MLQLARAIVGVVSDLLSLLALFVRSSGAIRAENLVLRRQLARYLERGIKPRRVDYATRVSLALFSRLFDWRDAVVIDSQRYAQSVAGCRRRPCATSTSAFDPFQSFAFPKTGRSSRGCSLVA